MEPPTTPPPGRGNEPEPTWERAHETMERERERLRQLSEPSPLEDLLRRAERRMMNVCERLKSEVRTNPAESVGLAAVAGFFAHRLPLGALAVTGTRVLAAFAPPVLIALGICKTADHLRRLDAEWQARRFSQKAPVPAVPPSIPPAEGL